MTDDRKRSNGSRDYHVVAEIHWEPHFGCGTNAPPPRRVAVGVQAYTADDAIVQVKLLVKQDGWLLGHAVTPAYGEARVAKVVVLSLHPQREDCSARCADEWR